MTTEKLSEKAFKLHSYGNQEVVLLKDVEKKIKDFLEEELELLELLNFHEINPVEFIRRRYEIIIKHFGDYFK